AGAAYLYYLTNPPSGTGTVSITLTGPHFFIGTAVSYAGVAQTNPIDVQGTNAAEASTYTQSVTTTVADDWTLLMGTCDGSGSPAPASGSTQRGSDFATGGLLVDSGGSINPGSTSLGFSDGYSNSNYASVMVGFKSAGPSAPTN